MKKKIYISLVLYKWWKWHPYEHIDHFLSNDEFVIPNKGDYITYLRKRDDTTFFLHVKSRDWTYKDNGDIELEIVCTGIKSK